MRASKLAVAITVAASYLLAPTSNAFTVDVRGDLRAGHDQRLAATEQALEPPEPRNPYEGLASWVDMYNRFPWKHPKRTIDRMKRRKVKTLYLQTSNYSKRHALYRSRAMARLVDAAHNNDIQVVAWYVPSFKNLRRDFRRIKAALRFRTPNDQKFDSFALDIEATTVSDISRRNQRLLRLSKRLRNLVGPSKQLGAIVPDSYSTYWPYFPYKGVAGHYDVFLPMAYYTYRVKGADAVHRFTSHNINTIRTETGDETVPVHAIGGIAGRARRAEVGAFVKAARDGKAIGVSLYDFPLTTTDDWEKLARF
ncbi:MAG: hypothetical protein ACRDKB_01670 [Actinomycetota bacterium]